MTTRRGMDVRLSISDQEEILEQRRHDPAQPDKIMDPELFRVAKEGDVAQFIKALEDHRAKESVSLPFLFRLRSPSKNTLLHIAAESDDKVNAVINSVPQAMTYCQNSRGENPLHIAARAGKASAVNLLLSLEMPMINDHCGNSALHEAVRNRHHEVIRLLARKDPSLLHLQNSEGKSPLCVAVETGDLKVLELLLEALNDGEDWEKLKSQRISCMSPVHVAIIHKEKDMLAAMWEKERRLFQLRDAGDGTPLHLAAYMGYLDGVKFLIEKLPTSALEQDHMGYLPIHVACMMNYGGIVSKLLKQWSDPAEFLTRLGQNILHVSARHGSIAIVKSILKIPTLGHLINARDFNGNTPLHLAALHCQPSVVLLARDRRVDNKLVNMNNMTALDVVNQDIKVINPPLQKRFTSIAVYSAGTPRSKELAICDPIGRSPRKRLEPPEWKILKDRVNTCSVVLALVASVTFTSGFSIPGGYKDSEGDAGIPTLLHKAMFNVFVICNSIAMYSSIMSLVILLFSQVNDPYIGFGAIFMSYLPFSVTLITMPLAFMAGVYVTTAKLNWLSIFGLVLGSIALFMILSLFILLFLPCLCRLNLIRCCTDRMIFLILVMARRELVGSETDRRAARFVWDTRDDTHHSA